MGQKESQLAFIVRRLYALPSTRLSIHNICSGNPVSAGQPGEFREGYMTYPWTCAAGSGVDLGLVSVPSCFLIPGITF